MKFLSKVNCVGVASREPDDLEKSARNDNARHRYNRVCAQTRLAARVRMQDCKLTYQNMRYAAIRIETHTRRMLSMQRRKEKAAAREL